jgi:fumarate hydratase class II
MVKQPYRVERDTMGEVRIPVESYYGAETQRAIENFGISQLRFQPIFIRNLALVKLASAKANMKLGLLDEKTGKAITTAAESIWKGEFYDEFPLDIFQTGSGTSTNMNMNEVISNLATRQLGGKLGDRTIVHPNDHVNLGQSTNDVFPTTINLAAAVTTQINLLPNLRDLHQAFKEKAAEFRDVIKGGRTHWQDAVPITLGQEFGGYASTILHGIRRIEEAELGLRELPLGGTAVGTGLNTHPKFSEAAIRELSKLSGIAFHKAENSFEALQGRGACVELSGALKGLSTDLDKIANDLRILSSGPLTGLGEIELPALQPGSSIMPGKVNPVIPEAIRMVSSRVIGNDVTITLAEKGGEMELNVMMPIIAYCLLESIELMSEAAKVFAERCVKGIRANVEKCLTHAQNSAALVTAVSPLVGYDAAAKAIVDAKAQGKTVRRVLEDSGMATKEQLDRALDLRRMTRGGRST